MTDRQNLLSIGDRALVATRGAQRLVRAAASSCFEKRSGLGLSWGSGKHLRGYPALTGFGGRDSVPRHRDLSARPTHLQALPH